MKPVKFRLYYLLGLLLFIAACTKNDLPDQPTPPVTDQPGAKGMVRFVSTLDLTGQPYHSSNLHAVVSINKKSGEAVITDQLMNLDLFGDVKTSVMELPEGDYLLTAFRITYGYVQTHFAIPFIGSHKASAVDKPLAIEFTVIKSRLNEVAVQPLKIAEGERPQLYGYPAGAFDNGQEENNPNTRVKLRARMVVGDVVYDSIPASLALTTWDAQGQMTTSYIALAAGTNEIPVSKSASKFEFTLTKWGITDKLVLNREDIDPSVLIVLGGSKEAKKLRSERVYRLVNWHETSESKTDYFYDHEDKLLKIDYYLRKPDGTPYFAMTDIFTYGGSQLQTVKKLNPDNNQQITETNFTYGPQGVLTNIREAADDFETMAAISYHSYIDQVVINYMYPGRSNSMDYYMTFEKGNMQRSAIIKPNHDNSVITYSYDLNINPYRHMNWPDIFLSHSSKNNVTSQQHHYSGSFPTHVAYSFEYTYDADGYPKTLIKHYRSYPGDQYSHSTKTYFDY